MRYHSFCLQSQTVIIGPAPAAKLSALEIFLQLLAILHEEVGAEGCREIGQTLLNQIVRLLTRIDSDLDWDPLEMDTQTFEEFFFGVAGQPPLIIKLHEINPVESRPEPQPGQSIDNWTPPIPSCGDPEIDLIGNLIAGFGVREALELWHKFDYDSLNKLLWVYNENQVDPEERRQKYLADYWQKYKSQNKDLLKSQIAGFSASDLFTKGV